MMQIRKAERMQAKLRLGIAGPSGSGKTWSALEIATGLTGKIGMIDTESGRGEFYAGDFEYDVIRLDAPYSVERYIEAINTFEKAGYDILIIDSLSHAWNKEGGVLSVVENAGGTFQNGWKKGTPLHNALIDKIVTCKMHIITTLRVKTEYVVETNEKGKQAPRKVGLAPIQRDELEYEFTVFMTMSQEHIAHISKDNTKLFDQQFIKPTRQMGEKLIDWLNSGISHQEHLEKLASIQEHQDNEKLNNLLNEIKISKDITELEFSFRNAWRELSKIEHQHRRNEFMEKITKEKDKKKEALTKESPQKIIPNGSLLSESQIGATL